MGEGGKLPLVVIIGPTAVGKTDIAIQLAERMNGEIVSADSRLFYRGMDIGTAKPTAADRARVTHYLIDVADPDQIWNLALFQKAAGVAINGIHLRGRLPFLVGGTGQYIRAVTHSWTPPATSEHVILRAALEALAQSYGNDWLHAKLTIIDPTAAAFIDPRNIRRMVRALEVIFTTGRKFSDQRGQGKSPYHLIVIGLTRPRQELYARIDTRIESMFAAGFLNEVRTLLKNGYSPDLPTMSAIGYRECIDILQGHIHVQDGIARMKRATRVFVRRQANWFKIDNPEIHWFNAGTSPVDEIIIDICKNLWGKGFVNTISDLKLRITD